MTKPYKLNNEIEQFILSQKRQDPKFSCRRLVSLIKEEFKVEVSKSSINKVIKAGSLSGKIGRPRIRPKPVLLPPQAGAALMISQEPPKEEPIFEARAVVREEPVFEAINFSPASTGVPAAEEIPPYVEPPRKQSLEIRMAEETSADIENGGAIFLLMADYKSGLIGSLASKVLTFMPDLSQDVVRLLIQSQVYGQIIKDKERLARFLGQELTGEYLDFYYEQMAKIPWGQLNPDFTSLGLGRNINEINMLYKECLLCLNRQVQRLFLPSVYQYLDFAAMCERFYSLIARITRKDALISVHFLYSGNFQAAHDIVWQEDFKSAVSALNKERIFTPDGKLFRFEETLAAYR